jgi:hypothetical protein
MVVKLAVCGTFNSGVEQPHRSEPGDYKENSGTQARIQKANGRELVGT